MTKRRIRVLVGALVAAMMLGACGGQAAGGARDNGVAGKSADEILKDTTTAYQSARSLHLKGDLVDNGRPIGLDLRIKRAGDLQGFMESQGVRMDLIKVGSATYVKGRKAWARFAGPQVAEKVGDRWALLPRAHSGASDLEPFANLDWFADRLKQSIGKIAKGGTSEVNGQPVVELKGGDGSLYVATTGKPYPVRMAPKPGTQPAGQGLDFTEYDADFTVKAPPGAVDLAKLGG